MMTLQRFRRDPDVVVGLLADYCGMLREAAYVLTGLADAPPARRREDFDALVGVHAESQAVRCALSNAVPEMSSERADPWRGIVQELTGAVQALFDELVGIGSAIDGWPGPLPAEVFDHCRLVESTSKALERAWQEQHDPVAVERHLWSVRLGVAAVEQALDGASLLERDGFAGDWRGIR